MADFLQIEEPAAKPKLAAPNWTAFLELAFRPLYIAGAVWAIVAVLLWVHSPTLLTGILNGVYWHAHEMLWGFIAP